MFQFPRSKSRMDENRQAAEYTGNSQKRLRRRFRKRNVAAGEVRARTIDGLVSGYESHQTAIFGQSIQLIVPFAGQRELFDGWKGNALDQ